MSPGPRWNHDTPKGGSLNEPLREGTNVQVSSVLGLMALFLVVAAIGIVTVVVPELRSDPEASEGGDAGTEP